MINELKRRTRRNESHLKQKDATQNELRLLFTPLPAM